jgi:hypothetical protein
VPPQAEATEAPAFTIDQIEAVIRRAVREEVRAFFNEQLALQEAEEAAMGEDVSDEDILAEVEELLEEDAEPTAVLIVEPIPADTPPAPVALLDEPVGVAKPADVAEPAKPKRAPRKKAAPVAEAPVEAVAEAEAAPEPAAAPKPKRAPRKKAA